jgi:hypothetical protein
MIRVKRTQTILGKTHISFLVLNEREWGLIQKNPEVTKNMTLEVVDQNGRPTDLVQKEADDKPTLEEYEELRIKGEKLYKKEKWEDALHYFKKAGAVKPSIFITGRINACVKKLNPEKDDKSDKVKRGRKPRKG